MTPRRILQTATATVIAAACALAFWQFDRAEQKRSLENQAREGLAAAPITVAGKPPEPLPRFRRAEAVGEYLPEKTILLDNRVRNKQAGYYVVTPLMLADGYAIAINRGWLPAGKTRNPPPEPPPPPAGKTRIVGALANDETGAFSLSQKNREGNVWQRLYLREYAAAKNITLLGKVLIRGGEDTSGETVPPPASVRADYKSARSEGYALQWLSLAALAAIFYAVLRRRIHP